MEVLIDLEQTDIIRVVQSTEYLSVLIELAQGTFAEGYFQSEFTINSRVLGFARNNVVQTLDLGGNGVSERHTCSKAIIRGQLTV